MSIEASLQAGTGDGTERQRYLRAVKTLVTISREALLCHITKCSTPVSGVMEIVQTKGKSLMFKEKANL